MLQVRLLRIEKRKKEDAERIRREEEERLRQQMREVEAKREAERLHRERLKQIEEEKKRDEEQMEEERRVKAEEVRRREKEAQQRRDMPVEDSQVVEEMFGFLGDQQPGDFDPCELHYYVYTQIYIRMYVYTCIHCMSTCVYMHIKNGHSPCNIHAHVRT